MKYLKLFLFVYVCLSVINFLLTFLTGSDFDFISLVRIILAALLTYMFNEEMLDIYDEVKTFFEKLKEKFAK